MAWPEYGLLRPNGFGWNKSGGGWVCEVWQSAYGHRANKATWLYWVGLTMPPLLDWRRPKGTHQVGCADRRGKERNKPTLSKQESAATPAAFRDALVMLAESSSAPMKGQP
jgi:hypothetical protein